MKLIDDASKEFHRLWSVQASLFFFILNGAIVGLAAFVNTVDPWWFLYLNMAGYGLIGMLRLIKQAPPVSAAPSTDAPKPDDDDPSTKEILSALRQLLKQQVAGAKS